MLLVFLVSVVNTRCSSFSAFGINRLRLRLHVPLSFWRLIWPILLCHSSMALGKYCRFHLVRVENEHPTFFSSSRGETIFLLDKATFMVETDLHALFYDLANQDQILHYSWNMQDVLDVGWVALLAVWDINDMSYWMCCVISSLYIAWSFPLSQVSKPFLMMCHMVWGAGVNKPYIFCVGHTSRTRGPHIVCFMPHHEHPAMIVVVEFAKFATVSALDGVVLSAWSGMVAPLLQDTPPMFATSCWEWKLCSGTILLGICSSCGRSRLFGWERANSQRQGRVKVRIKSVEAEKSNRLFDSVVAE